MNDELIITLPQQLNFHLDQSRQQELLDIFADKVHQLGYYSLSDFLYELSPEEFFQNLTEREYTYDDLTIPSNYKVIKAFKYFILDDEAQLKETQDEASRIIQENSISGYLCLSIHPLDYLSASENIHNWRSCHSLDGDYRSGNLNYMVDTSTIICYLRADKNAILPRFPENIPWNSKKWRAWLHFSNDKTLIYLGRQYPFFSKIPIDTLKQELLPSIGINGWGMTSGYQITYCATENNEYVPLQHLVPLKNGKAIALHDLVKNGTGTFNYNDILYSSVYTPMLIHNDYFLPSNNTIFEIGKKCPCTVCGKGYVNFNCYMVCDSCAAKLRISKEETNKCYLCRGNFWKEDLTHLTFSDKTVCKNCYESKNLNSCQSCGDRDLTNYIFINKKNNMILCPRCEREERIIYG